MGVRERFALKKELPPGRGFMVKAVQASLTQICLPVLDGIDGTSPDEHLGELISGIQKKYRKSAQWSYQAKDLSIIDTAILAITDSSDVGSSPATYVTSTESSDAMANLEKLLAEQATKKKTTSKTKSSRAKPAAKSTSSRTASKSGTTKKKPTTKK
jgi:hypothetical protein